jgi:hypothetical protein
VTSTRRWDSAWGSVGETMLMPHDKREKRGVKLTPTRTVIATGLGGGHTHALLHDEGAPESHKCSAHATAQKKMIMVTGKFLANNDLQACDDRMELLDHVAEIIVFYVKGYF